MKKENIKRYVCVFMALNILAEVVSPSIAMALTNGPIQQDYTSFEPATSTEMVDLFTGDFKYNIPLMDVDGYPLNLSYHGGPNMEEEAGWVGLGWTLNAGSMTRTMRGLPDDFSGDPVVNTLHVKPNVTIGVGGQLVTLDNSTVSYSSVPVTLGWGWGATAGASLIYNNYKGFGVELHNDVNLSGSINMSIGAYGAGISPGLNGGVYAGTTISSLEGSTVSYGSNYGASLSTSYNGNGLGVSANIGQGTSINTRTGALYKSYSSSLSVTPSMGDYTGSAGFGGTVSYPVNSIGYSPRMNSDYMSTGFSMSNKMGFYSCLGISLWGWNFQVEMGRYIGLNAMYSESHIMNGTKTMLGYGYLNYQNAGTNRDAVLDFNRYRDGLFYKETPNAPLAQKTYDIYTATAQGLHSTFRPQRSDIGSVYDNESKVLGARGGLDMEMGFGLIAHFLLGVNVAVNNGRSGKWNTGMAGNSYFSKNINNLNESGLELSYFKQMGEQTASDRQFDQKINGDNLSTPIPQHLGNSYRALSPLQGAYASASTRDAIIRMKRDLRQNNISYLTASQASAFGMEKNIRTYPVNSFSLNDCRQMTPTETPISRTTIDGNGIGHHISEVTVNPANGYRYVYGIPVYNKYKKEVIFNSSIQKFGAQGLMNSASGPLTQWNDQGMVRYNANDASVNNLRGNDQYYSSKEIPAYAQSFLLTSILSADYIDKTNNGPSDDDYGTYTKFNYSQPAEYKWRIPYGNVTKGFDRWALQDKGLIADQLDDKAMYEYGRRDLWYLHSVETKNHVVEFTIEARKDGMGVDDENGTVSGSTKHMYKLTKIKLFSKNEKARALAAGVSPVPIKTINFVYDYSLCKGVYNNDKTAENVTLPDGSVVNVNDANNQGKLTLKKVFISYGKSDRGLHTPYEFTYADPDHNGVADAAYNPDYDPKGIDRWGSYKPNSGTTTGDPASLQLNNDEFPYTEQRKDKSDIYAGAWNLSTVYTPTGSQMNVDYESDDYAYVQNEVAAQMLKIKDLVPTIASFDEDHPKPTIFNANYAIIDLTGLGTGISTTLFSPSEASELIKKQLFRERTELYFKCFTKLTNIAGTDYWDYIPGYADISKDDMGVMPSNYDYIDPVSGQTCYKYAYVSILKDGVNDNGSGASINPIAKAGWQTMRTYLPRLAYPGSEPANMPGAGNPLQTLSMIVSGIGTSVQDLLNALKHQPNQRFYDKGYCNQIVYNKSWVRAFVPFKKKIGGGHRVKQITLSDQWESMTSGTEKTSLYGQQYEYTTTDEQGNSMSSGVAQYESLSGGDEISLRKQIRFDVKQRMAPNDSYFQEEPVGEMLYPSPGIGYSKVTVKPLNRDANAPDDNTCRIGRTEYEFYTAKDFPVITVNSGCNKPIIDTDPVDEFTIIKRYTKLLHAFQGYVIKLNDMHGKVKSQMMYGENNATAPISGSTYYYKQSFPGVNGKSVLDNNVKTIDRNLVVDNEVIAREIDLTTDLRENVGNSINTGFSFWFNIGACLSSPVGFDLNIGLQTVGFRSAVMTKVVQQYGVLERVETLSNKAKSSMENLLWDRNTGAVVLTKTSNDYDKPIYSFNYPAYWMYDNMGNTFRRQNLTIKIAAGSSTIWNLSTGQLNLSTVANYLKPGDEVAVFSNTASSTSTDINQLLGGGQQALRAWVHQHPAGGNYGLITEDGTVLKQGVLGITSVNNNFIQVKRPADRNLNPLSAGSITTLSNPYNAGSNSMILNTDLLSAKANEYCNTWNLYYEGRDTECFGKNNKFNPYWEGFVGNWNLWKSYAYNTKRLYNTSQPDKKVDGTFDSYTPFWTLSGGTWNPIYAGGGYGRWVLQGQNTLALPQGDVLETKDALGNYSASLTCFNNTLMRAKASNAMYSEIAFESFEDLNYLICFNNCNNLANDHMNVTPAMNVFPGGVASFPDLSQQAAHAGRYSLQFEANDYFTLSHAVNSPKTVSPEFFSKFPARCDQDQNVFIEKLNLKNGKYIASFWIKGPSTLSDFSGLFSYDVVISGSPVATTVKQTNVINGWQKFEYTFQTTASPASLEFNFTANSALFMDDYRIQPFNASMECYVYDPYQLRMWAKLDGQNFATFIEYDNEGTLVRAKKETEKGIFTLSETRNSLIKR